MSQNQDKAKVWATVNHLIQQITLKTHKTQRQHKTVKHIKHNSNIKPYNI